MCIITLFHMQLCLPYKQKSGQTYSPKIEHVGNGNTGKRFIDHKTEFIDLEGQWFSHPCAVIHIMCYTICIYVQIYVVGDFFCACPDGWRSFSIFGFFFTFFFNT